MSNSTNILHQTGVLGGRNPIEYSTSDPLALFLVQAFIIISLCRIIQVPLSWINQPRVIAEVIAGIVLGPSVMGHVPNFTESIFPKASIPNLTVAANIGLLMFLFIVGMEVDLPYVKKNLRVALTVGLLSMIFPFGLGYAIAVGIYKEFATGDTTFGVYGLFIGVAMSVTALPVLARILTELRLLRDRVGVIVLSAGIMNDIVGWILLALTITLANFANGLNALYVVLLVLAWFLLQVFVVRRALHWYLRKSKGLEHGPSQLDIALILLLVMVSSFYTDIIGVHPIFGAFIVGVIIPRDNGFVIKLTEKIDDFVSVLLIPLYFALSGLSVNLGLLDSGLIWGYIIGIIVIAFVAKVAGGTLAARFNGLLWRESFSVGILMSCKGIVEIVVLNLGLNAKILTPAVFSMFMIMTLVTTFLTSPLTVWNYPVWYRQKVQRWRNGEINWDGSPVTVTGPEEVYLAKYSISKLIYLVDDFSSVSVLMSLVQLLTDKDSKSVVPRDEDHMEVHISGGDTKGSEESGSSGVLAVEGVRLLGLTQRTSDLIQATVDAEELGQKDKVLGIIKTFTQISKVVFTGKVGITLPRERASYLLHMSESRRDLIMVSCSDEAFTEDGDFYSDILATAPCQVGLFIDRKFSITGSWAQSRHIYMVHTGGMDCSFALSFALQLSQNELIKLTIGVFESENSDDENNRESGLGLSQDQFTIVQRAVKESITEQGQKRIDITRAKVPPASDDVELGFIMSHIKTITGAWNTRPNFKGNDLVILGNNAIVSAENPGSSSASSRMSAGRNQVYGPLARVIATDDSLHTSILICQKTKEYH